MPDSTDQRLGRIEEKLDKLADAMISLARAEEKLSALADAQTHQIERTNRLSVKIDEVADETADNTRTVQLVNKLFWVVMVAAIGAIASNIWM